MRKASFLLLILPLLIASCTKDKTPQPSDECTTCAAEVSFSKDVVPVLSASCSIPGCHSFDDAAEDLILDSANAYHYLTDPDRGYVDLNNPKQSAVYLTLIKSGSSEPMPPDDTEGPMPTDCEVNRIYCWIEQGAKNN